MYCGYIKRKRLQWKPSRSLQFLHMTVINSRKCLTRGHSDVPTNSVSGQQMWYCRSFQQWSVDSWMLTHFTWVTKKKNDNNKKRKSLTEETIWNKEMTEWMWIQDHNSQRVQEKHQSHFTGWTWIKYQTTGSLFECIWPDDVAQIFCLLLFYQKY